MPKFIRKKRSFPGPPEGGAGDRPDRYGRPGTDARTRVGTTVRNDAGKHLRRPPQETKKPESAFAYPVTFAGPGPSCFSDISDLPSRHPVRAHPAVTHPRKASGRSGQEAFLQFGFRHGTMAADVVERLAQAMHELVKILLVEEDLMPVVGRLAFGIDRLATLRDGQEIVISSRSPDIEKIGAPTRLDCFREDLVFMKFLPFAARCK